MDIGGILHGEQLQELNTSSSLKFHLFEAVVGAEGNVLSGTA